MDLRQRLAIWMASVAVVMGAAAFAWRSHPSGAARGAPAAESAPPDAAQARILTPGADGEAPLLIVVENTPAARPQAGLVEACLVYALPTESRITRFLAAHCAASSDAVGPVRSARRYMLDIASDLGAILVHSGYSAEALAAIRAQKLPVINEFWTPGPFWRDPARKIPHNLYARLDRLRAAQQKSAPAVRPRGVPYAVEPAPPLPPDAAPATTVTLDYGALYAVRYHYDAGQRRYLREQDGRPHLDADGRQIAPASVLIAFVRWWDVQEQGGPSSRIDLGSGGRLVVLREGHLIEGTWSRPKGKPLTLQDAAGQPVVLPPGPVWIELFPLDRPFAASAAPPSPAPR